jgi:hypothetical protein
MTSLTLVMRLNKLLQPLTGSPPESGAHAVGKKNNKKKTNLMGFGCQECPQDFATQPYPGTVESNPYPASYFCKYNFHIIFNRHKQVSPIFIL